MTQSAREWAGGPHWCGIEMFVLDNVEIFMRRELVGVLEDCLMCWLQRRYSCYDNP